MSKDVEKIIPDFFRILIEQTIEYDKYLSNVFQRYSESLLSLDEAFSKTIFSSLGMLDKEKLNSLEFQSEEIVKRLTSQKLKIITFIDDLDRLSGTEIMAVLKLIRNSFNFPNTFFIVAYDENHVRREMGKLITEPEAFLEKIFQLEIDLPSYPNELIESQLLHILLEGKSSLQQSLIKQAISFLSTQEIIQDKVKNMRDVIRLSNSFNHVYWKKSNEIDTVDFLLLEILKLKSKPTYSAIRTGLIYGKSNELLTIPTIATMSDGMISFNDLEKYDLPSFELDRKILRCLFTRKDSLDEVKAIRYVHNIIRYFSDDLFGNISYSTFECYRDETFERFKSLIDSRENDIEPLINLILLVNTFSNINELSNILRALLHISNKFEDYKYSGAINALLKKNISEIKSAMGNPEGLSVFVKAIMVNDTIDALAESKVLGEFLDYENHNSEAWLSFLPKEDLIDWLLTNLRSFIARHSSHFDFKVYDIYYPIVAEINNYILIMSKEANDLLKQYIIDNQETYFRRWLIRKKYSGNIHQDVFVFEPFMDQYLGWEIFEKLLFSQTNSADATYLQSFYIKYKANTYTEVQIEEGTILIHSDRNTSFVNSPDYPDLLSGKSIETDRKKAYSSKFDIFRYSTWITQRLTLSVTEAINGGVYIFKREFTLEKPTGGFKSAILHCLVDDWLNLTINGKPIDPTINGFEQLNSVDIKEYLIDGLNEIIFNVGNVKMTEDDIKGDPEKNPFDFIYTIEIKCDDR